MEKCYDCNHCEVCRWIDKFKDKGVCDFYETLDKHDEEVIKETVESIWGKPPYNDVLDKIRAEIMDFEEELFHRPNTDYTDYAAVRHCVEIIDKYRKEQEDADSD